MLFTFYIKATYKKSCRGKSGTITMYYVKLQASQLIQNLQLLINEPRADKSKLGK